MRLRRKSTEFGALERRLREERTTPSEGLRASVSQLTSWRGDHRRHSALRLGLAVAITAVILVAAGLLSGVSYAGGGNGGQGRGPSVASRGHDASSSNSQYGEKVIICQRTHKSDHGQTLRVPPEVAKIMLRIFRWDTLGPCR